MDFIKMEDLTKMDFTILKELDTSPSSGGKILAAFIPTFLIALLYFGIFVLVRNSFRQFYAPRTFLGTIPEKHRTPVSRLKEGWWFRDFTRLSDGFVLRHNSLDAYLYLRFLRFVVWICVLVSGVTFVILLPINANGGGRAKQLDRLTFGNIARNDYLWAHLVVAWVLFGGIFVLIAYERLTLIGTRQAFYVNEEHASRLSARTVLFLNVPHDKLQPDQLQSVFGEKAKRSWPVANLKDLEKVVEERNNTALRLERAEFDMIVKSVKKGKHVSHEENGAAENGRNPAVAQHRPTKRTPPLVGDEVDLIAANRLKLEKLVEEIAEKRDTEHDFPSHSAVFVEFESQQDAHIAYQEISFQPKVPLQDRFLAVQPKEVIWNNLTLQMPERVSRATFALAFFIAFNIFFAIPVGLLGTLSNARELANRYKIFAWLKDLPTPILDLLTGLVPPALTSWFTSYVPKFFRRHLAKQSGEVTVPQAELKVQAWYFVFQITQIFLVTTFSSGAAAVVSRIMEDPTKTPDLLAANLPKASNFYLTYIILQGTTNAANNLLNYSDLLEYLFYEYFWDVTPREKFNTFAQMKGTPWATWYPKFTTLFIIAVAYACIAPLVTGFAAVGIFFYYLSYRYSLLYVRQTKIDTHGECYKRALQQMPTALYFAELGLIGLFGARKAAAQTTLMIVLLVLTAVANLLLDRMLRPLDLYLGVDKWKQQEVPLLAEEDSIDPDDEAGLHAASHGRRLGLKVLPNPAPRWLSDIFDSIISTSRDKTKAVLDAEPAIEDAAIPPTELSEDELRDVYAHPALTSKTPKIWLPRDPKGVSKALKEENAESGIETTDDGAEIDEKGKLIWDHRFENVPIWKPGKVY